MIKVLDFGVGNIQSVINAFEKLGVDSERALCAEDIAGASKLVIPGVGAFDYVIEALNHAGIKHALEDAAFVRKIPILGICVGMQIFAESSEEGNLPGLGWVPGHVKALSRSLNCKDLIMPHMGWNSMEITGKSKILSGINENSKFYYLHSYYYECSDKTLVLSRAQYGEVFDCAIQKNNIYGIQCHPEKSHSVGAVFLKNFAEI